MAKKILIPIFILILVIVIILLFSMSNNKTANELTSMNANVDEETNNVVNEITTTNESVENITENTNIINEEMNSMNNEEIKII